MYTQNTTQKELGPSAKIVYPRFRIAGPCNSAGKKPTVWEKNWVTNNSLYNTYIYNSSHNRSINTATSVEKN